MEKVELEVKILNIDKEYFIARLESLGAEFVEECNQFLYTYDMPTIYGRYIDLLTQLNYPESDIKYEASLAKLKLLFFDFDNLLTDDNKKELSVTVGFDNLTCLLEKEDILDILNRQELTQYISKFHNDSRKWIRLRETQDKTTLAVKHKLADNGTSLQQLLETEIEVPGIKEGNELLEALGLFNKSYQEKRRITYKLDGYEIDIDSWPGIPTYFEVEGKDRKDLEKILNKLGYSIEDAISCTAEEVYEMNGKSMFDKRELRFDDN